MIGAPADLRGRIVAAAAILTLTAGCGTLASTNSKHFIIVHKEGYPISQDRKRLAPNEFEKGIWPAIQEGIDQHIKDAENAKETPRLLLYVHGGLTTYQGALDHEDKLLKAQGTPQTPRLEHLSKHHLLFINWDSSLATSVLDDLFLIRLGQPRPVQGPLSSPFITAARLAQSGLLAPQSLYLQIANAIEAVTVDDDAKWRECAPAPAGEVSDASVGPHTVTFFAFYPLRALSVPLIQGFGTPAWDIMKRRAELVVAPQLVSVHAGLLAPQTDSPLDQGGGRLLMDLLRRQIPGKNKWRTKDGVEKELEITLMGHSMGTMILNRILEDYADIHFHRIVYLAAAASIDSVRGSVLPYLRRHPTATFWGFSLSEPRESGEWNVVDVFERGSLLVWIDHLFERINAPSDRTFGRARDLRNYFTIPEEFTENAAKGRRIFLVKFNRGQHDPEKHGDFSKPEILERVLRIVHGRECPKQP